MGQQKMSTANKRILIILTLLFFVPFFGGYWYFFYMSKHGGIQTTNNGHLIAPPILMEQLLLTDHYNRPLNLEQWQGAWQLAYQTQNTTCDKNCLSSLDNLFRLHIALNKNQQRLQRWLLMPNSTSSQQGNSIERLLQQDYPGTMLAISQLTDVSVLNVATNFEQAMDENLYLLVDPVGNIMMYYPANTAPDDILKDIEKLMKISKIG